MLRLDQKQAKEWQALAICTRLCFCLPGLQHGGGLWLRGSCSTAAGLNSLAACPPARSCCPSLQDLCRAPSPGEKGCAPSGAEPHRQPKPASWSPRALGQLLLSSIWSQGRGGKRKVGEVSGTASLQSEQGGAAQPRTAPTIIYHPHPIEACSLLNAECCTDVVSTVRRMCFWGCAMCSSGPQHTFVPCLVTRMLAAPSTRWPLTQPGTPKPLLGTGQGAQLNPLPGEGHSTLH